MKSIFLFCLLAAPFAPALSAEILDSEMNYISARYDNDIQPILENKCFACHHRGHVPWYARILPPLRKQYKKAQAHVNMTHGFPFGGKAKLENFLVEFTEMVSEGRMPPKSYLKFKPKKALTASERQIMLAWARDSLVMVRD